MFLCACVCVSMLWWIWVSWEIRRSVSEQYHIMLMWWSVGCFACSLDFYSVLQTKLFAHKTNTYIQSHVCANHLNPRHATNDDADDFSSFEMPTSRRRHVWWCGFCFMNIFALCVLYTSKSKYTQSHWIRDVLHSSYYMTMLYGNEGIVGYWSLAQGSGSSTIALCLEAAAKQVVRFRGIGQHWTVYMETLLPSVMVERVLHDEWSVLWYGGVVNLDNEGWFTLLHSTL